jgi:outer membrane protein assembly factor BamB
MKSLVAAAGLLISSASFAADWPQWMGPNRDGVWSETGIVEKFPEGGPKVLWRTPIKAGYSGPAVVGDRVYVMDYDTNADLKNENFTRTSKFDGEERVLCLNAADGSIVWTHKYPKKYTISYPSGPRCTPTVHEGKVYALGAEGDLWCLDAATGKVVWSKDFVKDYKAKTPMWGFCGHPLVDGDKLICVVGGKNACTVAFNKNDGKEIWKALDAKEPGYAPPTMIEAGGKRQLLIWHSEGLNALNPETGEKYWSSPLAVRMAMGIMAPQKSGDLLYAGGVWGAGLSLKLDPSKPAVTESWRSDPKVKTKGLYPMNMTPFAEDGVVYGVDQPGQMRAVKIETGEHLWESWLPVTGKAENKKPVFCGTAFVVKNSDRFFIFNELGELVIAKMDAKGYNELGRAKLLEPTGYYPSGQRNIVWSHPAFANKCCYARNDKEIVCVSLAN